MTILIALSLGAAPMATQAPALTQPLANVTFDTGSATIDGSRREQLRAAVAWAHDHPWRLLVIEGYADRVGGRSANLVLSQDRADAVRAVLLELGADPDRIISAAYGEDDPDAGRHVLVRGTLDDFRDLIEHQHMLHTPSPRAPGSPGV